MAISLKKTSDLEQSGVKLLVYGQAGAGKTSLIPTLPNPIILSAEGGLLSIKDSGLPFIEISSGEEVKEAYRWMKNSSEAKQFKSVAIDSISEVAEVILCEERKVNKDPRAAYGNMMNNMSEIIRQFRDLSGVHVYMSAKLDKRQDELGRILYSPGMPGNKFGPQMPYFFDELLALRVEKDADGNVHRALMSSSDGLWEAKDRSSKLDAWEAPDLGAVISKILGVQS